MGKGKSSRIARDLRRPGRPPGPLRDRVGGGKQQNREIFTKDQGNGIACKGSERVEGEESKLTN